MNLFSKILLLAPLVFIASCGPTIVASPPSQYNDGLQGYYAAAEAALRKKGHLRTETNPADAPFSEADLVRNFENIALYDEYTVLGGQFIARRTPTYIRRWESPVRVGITFGASIPAKTRFIDQQEITKFPSRLGALTGLDMRVGDEANANMLVLVLNDAEQQEFAQTLPERYPNISPAVVDSFRNSPSNIFCAAFAFPTPGQKGVYGFSLILIKSEHSDLMRKSCIHEEMAQAMGLSNDSPSARPSIFNDDEEFALLTRHDEILLQMLYDPRLTAGMEANEALPLLPAIAHDAAR